MDRLELHLCVGKAQRRESSRRVSLIAKSVACLLRRRSVVAQSIGLDNETKLGPVEVHLEPIHPLFGRRPRQSGLFHQRQEQPLQLRASQPEGASIENRPKASDARLAFVFAESLPQSVGADEIEPIGLIDRSLQTSGIDLSGEVEQGPNRAGEGDAMTTRDVSRFQGGTPMDADSRPSQIRRGSRRDFDATRRLGADTPECGCASVAQRHTLPTTQDRRHPPPVTTEFGPPDRVNTAHHPVQPPSRHPVLNRSPAQAQLRQLPA